MNDGDNRKLVPPPLPKTQAEIEAIRRWAPTPLERHPAIDMIVSALWNLSEVYYYEDDDTDIVTAALPPDYPVGAEWFKRLHDELWEVFTRYMAEASPNRRIATRLRVVTEDLR